MMTCDSCPVCPVPLKRTRNIQIDGDRVIGEDGSVSPVAMPCGDARRLDYPSCGRCCCSEPRFRKPPAPLHVPTTPFSLSLGGRPYKRLQQQQHQHQLQILPLHQTTAAAARQQRAAFSPTAMATCGRCTLHTVEADTDAVVDTIDCHELAGLLNKREDLLLIDTRSFMDYNTSHLRHAVNVANSKIGKRRLQQERVSVRDLLVNNCDVDSYSWAVVYDTATRTAPGQLPADAFIGILVEKLTSIFSRVSLLTGGFNEFQSCYPSLVEDKQRRCVPLASALSQPCMPTTNAGLTRILPFLYLGSQQDAHNRQLLWDHNITYVLNVSASCPKADFIPEPQFLRIAVNDNYSEKLLPHFGRASHFVERARESGGCVLVHCLAGVSRSPTMAIAYVMKHLRMSSDDAYRYVKSKRPTISPNFNFLGQLLEYEKQLRREKVLEASGDICSSAPVLSPSRPLSPAGGLALSPTRERDLPAVSQKKQRLSPRTAMLPRQLTLVLKRPMETVQASPPEGNSPASGAVSPTTGIARLNFGGSQENLSVPDPTRPFEAVARSMSCNLEWLGTHEDENLPPIEIERNVTLSPSAERPQELAPVCHLQQLQQSHLAAQQTAEQVVSPKRKEPSTSKALCKTLSAASLRRHLLRSDSVSTSGTSGYGSQISDHLDTLEDDILSDSDESVVLRLPHSQGGGGGAGSVAGDANCGSYSSYSSGIGSSNSHGLSKVSRHDSAYRSMTFEEGIALGSRERERQQKTKPLGSPLSPSEQHFIADFEPVCSDTGRGMADSWRSQGSSSHAELESSHDSGFVASLTSSRNSLTSSMRSSVMSSSGYSTCSRFRDMFCSATVTTTSPHNNGSSGMASVSCASHVAAYSQQAMGRLDALYTQPACSNVTHLVTGRRAGHEHMKQLSLPRARSLPGLEVLRAGDPSAATGCLLGQQPRNRHSYSGAIDTNRESPGSPGPTRMAVSIAVS